jgi:hypothetical protein
MASTLELYLLALVNNMGQGATATPVNTTANGTASSGTTETQDTTIGVFQWNATAGRRYMAVMNGLIANGTIANDVFSVRIRNSNSAATPTAASILVAESTYHPNVAGTNGREEIPLANTFTATVSGTNTIAFFSVRTTGTGVFTPLAPAGDGGVLGREMYVVDLGVF